MSLTLCAAIFLTSLAPGEQTSAVDTWQPYPAYSSPPLVAAGVVKTNNELPPAQPLPPAQSQVARSEARAPLLAAMVDTGVPDGAAASITFRPWRWLRLQAGGMHNLISPGIRGGLSLVPFYFWITPSLNLEAGHFFPGDATWIAHRLTSNRNLDPVFQRVGYDFGNAQVGLELGSPRGATFFLRAGVSYVQMTGNGVQQAIRDPTIQASNVKLSGIIPSAKLGLIIYFF